MALVLVVRILGARFAICFWNPQNFLIRMVVELFPFVRVILIANLSLLSIGYFAALVTNSTLAVQFNFRERVNNYKSHFRSYCERKVAGTLDQGKTPPQAHLFSHFAQDNHKGLDAFRFQVIDSSNTEVQLRGHGLFGNTN